MVNALSLYRKLPYPLQNAAVSLYGEYLAGRRYEAAFPSYLSSLMRSQWLSKQEFRELQNKLLRQLLREAYEDVPFYREQLASVVRQIDSITVDDLPLIPVLEKQVLRENVGKLTNQKRLKKWGKTYVQTSGTTGSPIRIPYDWDSMRRNLAIRRRFYRWHGITGSETSVRFSGRAITNGRQAPPFWCYNRPERQWFFSTYHLREDIFPFYINALRRINPVYLDGYPSALYVLARWMVQKGITGAARRFDPWLIITTGETLGDAQRLTIATAFGCPVINYYSSSEGAPYITDVPGEDGMLLAPESGIVEFLDSDGQPAGDLGTGSYQMVITSFFQRAVPLIRYRIGDMAILDSKRAGITRRMPRVVAVAGRDEDVLVGGDGRHVGMVSYRLFKQLTCVREAQIIQTRDSWVTLRIVPEPGFKTHDAPKLDQLVRDILGPNSKYVIEIVENIPRGPNGKFRSTIRE